MNVSISTTAYICVPLETAFYSTLSFYGNCSVSALSNILFQIKIDEIKYKRAWENCFFLAVVAESHDNYVLSLIKDEFRVLLREKIRVDDCKLFSVSPWEGDAFKKEKRERTRATRDTSKPSSRDQIRIATHGRPVESGSSSLAILRKQN